MNQKKKKKKIKHKRFENYVLMLVNVMIDLYDRSGNSKLKILSNKNLMIHLLTSFAKKIIYKVIYIDYSVLSSEMYSQHSD